jgi:hypothetical protein
MLYYPKLCTISARSHMSSPTGLCSKVGEALGVFLQSSLFPVWGIVAHRPCFREEKRA